MFPWGPFFLVFLTYVYRNALIPRNQPYPKNFLVSRLKFQCLLLITKNKFTYFCFTCSFTTNNLIKSSQGTNFLLSVQARRGWLGEYIGFHTWYEVITHTTKAVDGGHHHFCLVTPVLFYRPDTICGRISVRNMSIYIICYKKFSTRRHRSGEGVGFK